MRNPGIHARLLIGVFAIIGGTTFALAYMGMNFTRQFVQTRFEERISFLAKYLALNAELGILIDDKPMLQRLATNLLSEKDVVSVTVFDRSGGELASISKKMARPFSVIDVPVLLSRSQEVSEAFQWNDDAGDGDLPIGRVRIVYSTVGIEQLLIKMRNRFIWLSSGLGLLAAVIFYFLSHSLVAPLKQLAQAARDIEKGNRDIRVQPGSLPETRKLALAFNSMLDSLERSANALEDAYQKMIQQKNLAEMGKFSMMIAHEVKNPLSIIKSSLDILKEDMSITSENTMVGYMEDEIRRLNRLIEDFLAFARPVQPMLRRVEINSLIGEIVARVEMQKAKLPVRIRTMFLPEPCHVHADPDLIVRVFDNILKNSFEANDNMGAVSISVSRAGEALYIDVEDQGEGIEPENMEKIFEPFFTTRSKGTGLGLAYAAQVLRTHGGAISAKNKEEGGALFRVSLPVNEK
ncbi:MAG: two-component sensor histidine kinase [Deltaproteobacteria bacterium CG23_combo_of_CG06-09_8_20_14_all_51_20]|nr:MAG: two-component sensor histidine kinase [Deltaproteobacteria bacterium CG23_combo_of_CG06-09_8_20_14_all_51_20]